MKAESRRFCIVWRCWDSKFKLSKYKMWQLRAVFLSLLRIYLSTFVFSFEFAMLSFRPGNASMSIWIPVTFVPGTVAAVVEGCRHHSTKHVQQYCNVYTHESPTNTLDLTYRTECATKMNVSTGKEKGRHLPVTCDHGLSRRPLNATINNRPPMILHSFDWY